MTRADVVYTAIYSRIYAARMRYLHRRGRHGRRMGNPHSPVANGRCTWCGEA